MIDIAADIVPRASRESNSKYSVNVRRRVRHRSTKSRIVCDISVRDNRSAGGRLRCACRSSPQSAEIPSGTRRLCSRGAAVAERSPYRFLRKSVGTSPGRTGMRRCVCKAPAAPTAPTSPIAQARTPTQAGGGHPCTRLQPSPGEPPPAVVRQTRPARERCPGPAHTAARTSARESTHANSRW